MAGMNRPVGLSIGCGLVRDACEEPAPGGLCGLPPVCSVPESVNRVQPTPGRAGGVAGSLGPLGARAVQVRSKCMERKHVQSKHAQGKYASNRGAAHRFSVEGWQIHCTGSTGNRWSTFPTQHMEALLLWFDRSGQRQRAEAGRNKSIGWAERGAKTNKLKQAPRLLPRRAQRGPGLCRWGAPGRAGRPGPLGVATRESLISPGVAGRGSRVGDPPRPCQPCRKAGGPAAAGSVKGSARSSVSRGQGRSESEERCSVHFAEPAADRRTAAVSHSPGAAPVRARKYGRRTRLRCA